jgi:NAD(P)-dependent dehydrogenase (short-subunit alcohol dehydrogenase family)
MSAKRILLIGASRHIGYHVLEYLAPQPEKYALFVLARSPADKIAEFEGKKNVTFIQGDAKDKTVVNDAINNTMNGNVDFIVISVGIFAAMKEG